MASTSPTIIDERSLVPPGLARKLNTGLADENEDIRVHVVSREQAYQWVEEGKIDNAASVIALQWLQLHHQALKNEWA